MADDELVFEDDISEPTTANGSSNGHSNGNGDTKEIASDNMNNKRKHDDTNGNTNGTSTAMDEEEDDDEEEEEEEEEAEPFQPVTDGRDITLENRSLNKFLTCTVCTGYFREAHTITECLHTFCRSCIVTFWQKQEDTGKTFSCPKCLQAVGAAEPVRQCLRLDRVIQSLVDKIMPNYAIADEELKAKIFEPLTKQKSTISSSSSTAGTTSSAPVSSSNSFIICQLLPEAVTSSSTTRSRSSSSVAAAAAAADLTPLPSLSKPWLRTALQLTVRQAKKYLVQKSIVTSAGEVEITCRGEILGNDHTLDFIKKTRWHATALAADLGYHSSHHSTITDASRVLVLHYRRARALLTTANSTANVNVAI